MHTLRNGSTGYITLRELFDNIDREFLEGAIVVGTLKNAAGTVITGAESIAMDQVSGTTGAGVLYRGEVPHTIALPGGTTGTLIVTATSAANKVRRWPEPVRYLG